MNETCWYSYLPSPVGRLLMVADEVGLKALYMEDDGKPVPIQTCWVQDDCRLTAVRTQLEEYFRGERTTFDLPLSLSGTAFQRRVWEELRRIPFGETTSYSEIARAIGNPKSVRAVGTANGSNPVAIIVPCHRVIGKGGSLTGYAGGLPRKRWLLHHERKGDYLPLE
jgi:methylated-DNA-[protein]-cysteine S-methyltransferase